MSYFEIPILVAQIVFSFFKITLFFEIFMMTFIYIDSDFPVLFKMTKVT